MKKRGFGEGKYNGIGGKVEDGESVRQAAARELYEEIGVHANEMEKAAEITFLFNENEQWNQIVHIFLIRSWNGDPIESEEMRPKWFDVKSLPFETMWPDDKYWLPLVLSGKKIKGEFTFGKDNVIENYALNELDSDV